MRSHRFAELRGTPPLLLAQKILRRVPFTPIDIGKLCFLRLNTVPRVPAGLLRGPGVVRSGSPDDLENLVKLRDQRAIFLKRFASGDRPVVAEVDGRIVGYEWFCEGEVH